jgi:excisionase family DNA binding protein
MDQIGSAEAAEVLGIDRSGISRLVSAGKLKPITKLRGATGAYLFSRADVEAYSESVHSAPADSDTPTESAGVSSSSQAA